MSAFNPQAEELNQIIRESNPAVYELLSDQGKGIFFPKRGILKQAAEAKGKEINATVGMAIEDDGSPMRLPSIARRLDLDPANAFPYASSYGLAEIRSVWREMIYKKNPSLKAEASLPVVTNGLTHGLSMAAYLFVDPGDEIIITDAYWGNYNLIFSNGFGSSFKTFNTFDNDDFDLNALKERLDESDGKTILLLNFPNNPTGYTLKDEEADQLVDLIRKSAENKQIVVLIDDAYFGLVYRPGIYTQSIFSKLADIHENVLAVKIDGATKEDYVWGFRLGFLTYSAKGLNQKACQALESKTAGAIRGNISNASHLSQSLHLSAIASEKYQEEKRDKFELLKNRYDTVYDSLRENGEKYSSYFKALPFNSGYFMCVELNDDLDTEQVRQALLNDFSTGLVAVKNRLRIAFSSVPAAQIPKLFENIYKACVACSG